MTGQVQVGVNILAARLAHASVEASAFIWTKEGRVDIASLFGDSTEDCSFHQSEGLDSISSPTELAHACAGFRAFMLLHSLAILWALGPKKTVSIGLQCGIACSAARFAVVLAGSSKQVLFRTLS